jgi:hypothetical protein
LKNPPKNKVQVTWIGKKVVNFNVDLFVVIVIVKDIITIIILKKLPVPTIYS